MKKMQLDDMELTMVAGGDDGAVIPVSDIPGYHWEPCPYGAPILLGK